MLSIYMYAKVYILWQVLILVKKTYFVRLPTTWLLPLLQQLLGMRKSLKNNHFWWHNVEDSNLKVKQPDQANNDLMQTMNSCKHSRPQKSNRFTSGAEGAGEKKYVGERSQQKTTDGMSSAIQKPQLYSGCWILWATLAIKICIAGFVYLTNACTPSPHHKRAVAWRVETICGFSAV